MIDANNETRPRQFVVIQQAVFRMNHDGTSARVTPFFKRYRTAQEHLVKLQDAETKRVAR